MEVGLVIGLISTVTVVAVYFWVVRRPSEEASREASQR
jgi:hypothetical protein